MADIRPLDVSRLRLSAQPDPAALREAIRETKKLTSKPFVSRLFPLSLPLCCSVMADKAHAFASARRASTSRSSRAALIGPRSRPFLNPEVD